MEKAFSTTHYLPFQLSSPKTIYPISEESPAEVCTTEAGNPAETRGWTDAMMPIHRAKRRGRGEGMSCAFSRVLMGTKVKWF